MDISEVSLHSIVQLESGTIGALVERLPKGWYRISLDGDIDMKVRRPEEVTVIKTPEDLAREEAQRLAQARAFQGEFESWFSSQVANHLRQSAETFLGNEVRTLKMVQMATEDREDTMRQVVNGVLEKLNGAG